MVKEGASFCTRCGAAVAATPVAPGPLPPAAPPQAGLAAAGRGKLPLVLGIIGGLLVVAGVTLLALFLTVWSQSGAGENTQLELAREYMNALQNEDPRAYLRCIDPQYFKDMGLADAEAEEMVEGYFKTLNVYFIDVELEVEETSEDRSLVATRRGKLQLGSLDYSEERDLAEEPMYFPMVNREGRWYLEEDPMDQVMGLDEEYEGEGGLELWPEDFELDLPEELEMDLEELEKWLEDMNLEELEEWLKWLEEEEAPIQV